MWNRDGPWKFSEIYRNRCRLRPALRIYRCQRWNAGTPRKDQTHSAGKDKKMKTEKDMKELEQVNGGGFYEEMMKILHKIIPNPYDTDQDEKTDKTDARTGRGKC